MIRKKEESKHTPKYTEFNMYIMYYVLQSSIIPN